MKSRFLSFFLALFLLAAPFVFSGCLKPMKKIPYKITLEVWGAFDDSDAFAAINKAYKDANPQILEVRYKKISSDMAQYERELFDAIASGKGPDVFLFSNKWLSKHGNKIAPLPQSDQNLIGFKENFVDVAYSDYVEEDQIYAMPLDCDTLALYYSKSLLNAAGIPAPPKTWEELIAMVDDLTKVDQEKNIIQSAVALGRASNYSGGINRAPDILMLLMMQNGSEMFSNAGKTATFNASTSSLNEPGTGALHFYSSFSKGSSEAYTWNSKMDYSIDSFRYGKTAMMINYSYLAERLHKSDPKLDFDVTYVPQVNPERPVNFTNYWGLAVNRNKEIITTAESGKYTNENRVTEAWNYIKYVTMKPASPEGFDPTAEYLDKTGKSPARRDLIEERKNQVFWNIFAEQALTAKSWRQPDPTEVERIFDEMINDVASANATESQAIRTAANRVNALVKK